MVSRSIRRLLIVCALIGGFGLLWWATFTTAAWLTWLAWGFYGLLAVGLVVRWWRMRRWPPRSRSAEILTGQEPVQSIYSGQTPPTYYSPSADATSQITGPPDVDLLRLDGTSDSPDPAPPRC